jgi:8-hydroxy-5-deazaflavin:NADPH oxidoreductase
MKIAILGAGHMADALGSRWAELGHDLMIAGRTPDRARALAQKLGARSGGFAEAAEFGDIALLAVLYQGMPTTLDQIGTTLRGKPIIDCNNPVETERFTLVTAPDTALAETLEETTGGHVVKAFNLSHADVWNLDPPLFDGRRLVVPYCGDDPEALELTRQLIAALGCEPLMAGGLVHARYLEAMAAIVIAQLFGGRDSSTTFNLVDRLNGG